MREPYDIGNVDRVGRGGRERRGGRGCWETAEFYLIRSFRIIYVRKSVNNVHFGRWRRPL